MKKIITIIAIAISCSTLTSCTQFTPTKDNNFVMMRANDIQIQNEVADRHKHIDNPSHSFDLSRFLRELFSPKKPKVSKPLTISPYK